MRHLFLVLTLLAAPAARAAEAPDPAALQAEIAASHLEFARAVTLKNLKLNAGLATLHLDGVLVPASAVGGGTVELVFLGSGRIELEPPDSIEAGQLELFTGGSASTRSSRRRSWWGARRGGDGHAAPPGGPAGRGHGASGREPLYDVAGKARAQAARRRPRHPSRRPARSGIQGYLRSLVPSGSRATSSTSWSPATGSR